MGVYICIYKDLIRIIESDQISSSTLEISAKNGFDFINKVKTICNAVNGTIIASNLIPIA